MVFYRFCCSFAAVQVKKEGKNFGAGQVVRCRIGQGVKVATVALVRFKLKPSTHRINVTEYVVVEHDANRSHIVPWYAPSIPA